VHRLLKNDVVEKSGATAYALISQRCIEAMDIAPAALGMQEITETYEVIGVVKAWIHDLESRWQEEERRQRVRVTPDDSFYTVSVPTSAPPQVLWEFVTVPGRRRSWQAGVTDVIVSDTKGGRRGVGATTHCMHGSEAIVEEILDWRPYDYLTDRSTMNTPGGTIKMLSTFEIEPTTTGSIVHWRFGAPKTAKERAVLTEMLPIFNDLFAETARNLQAQLKEAVEARMADADLQPALPMPKADGLFSEMPKLQMVG